MKANKRKLKLLKFFNKRNNKNKKKRSGKKRKLVASAALGVGLLFGRLKTDSDKIQNHKPVTAIVHSISRSDELGKSGPGPWAKADAKKHVKTGSSSIFVNGFVPQNTYCRYHKLDPTLSCKPRVKASDNPFQDDGNHQPPQEGQESFDPSK